jgi:hypothetical protein
MPFQTHFKFIAIFLFLEGVFLIGVQPVRGDIYRYIDERGVTHFSNIPTGSEYVFFMKEEPQKDDIGYINELIQR